MSGGGHKTVELMENKASLSDLPDDPLSEIICLLDMKDAVKTSILSKRWRYIWANHVVDLKFNHVNILGLRTVPHKRKWAGLEIVFVKTVDKIMKQRLEGKRSKVNSFCIQFPLGPRFSSSIDGWIDFVVANNVETIDLDLSSHLPLARYNFSLLRAVSNNEKGTLKHLRLINCNFQGRSRSPKFGSLISIQLESVNISSLQLAKVLESCPLLEELTLDTCRNLTKLTINATLLKHLSLINCSKLKDIDVMNAQNLVYLLLEDMFINSLQLRRFIDRCPLLEELTLNCCPQLTDLAILESNNSPLKYLYMENCWKLMELELCANFLHTLEYYNITAWFSVMKTPRLVNVFIGEAGNIEHPLTNIPLNIPKLENLILASYHPLNFFLANDLVPALSLRRLVINVSLRNNDKDTLLYVSYILKAFPLLETLELNFRNFKKFDYEEIMIFEKCPNRAITKLEMNGFSGSVGEFNVLMYLLENLTGLRELAIGSSFKRYYSFNRWINDLPFTTTNEQWFLCNSEWLRTIVPPSVHLKLMKDLDSDLV
ncbi:putative F-box/LRR-repeat protein At3g18150 [Impatiens glandulifera]|uniref:putative F-box/LRR-repeat protein At3g18150 n=1 Tax=Impatiens glandulifera TaxID=253017 RepID=UPI001FB11975|nr:putative F-box/LRR-repeat protein At3g18150 [Impatiens glandulifera]